uniref:Ribosomal protein L33 n=1 Tax=Timema monikensis TaxID=170555 RepID=A0A7R9EF44_9NEOP|nr:unnamed protein product [Timema monikensis]
MCSRNVMVLLESVVTGHKYIQIRERLAEKMEVIMFDPYIFKTSILAIYEGVGHQKYRSDEWKV